MNAAEPLVYPAESMTPAIEYVLSLMCFQAGPIAHTYRFLGHDIAPRAEAEQAFVMDRFMRIALSATNFKAALNEELSTMKIAANEKRDKDTALAVAKRLTI